MALLETVIGVVYSLGTFFVIYALLALSLNIELGYCGISNFGKVAFYAIGAYVTGALSSRIALWMTGHVFDITSQLDPSRVDTFKLAIVNSLVTEISRSNPVVAVSSYLVATVVGVLVAGVFGLLASYPALRLRIDYLGITLLVFGEIVRIIGNSYEPMVGGPHSMAIPRMFAWMTSYGYPSYMPDLMFFLYSVVLFIVVLLVLERILNSPFGRALKMIRDDELAASTLGKDPAVFKAYSMVIGSMIAGLAGSLYVGYTGQISAGEYIPFVTFVVWTIVMLGGVGNNIGVLVGAGIWIGLDRALRVIKDLLPGVPFTEDYVRFLLTGVFIVLLVTYRPSGIVPEREVRTVAWTLYRSSRPVVTGTGGGGGED